MNFSKKILAKQGFKKHHGCIYIHKDTEGLNWVMIVDHGTQKINQIRYGHVNAEDWIGPCIYNNRIITDLPQIEEEMNLTKSKFIERMRKVKEEGLNEKFGWDQSNIDLLEEAVASLSPVN